MLLIRGFGAALTMGMRNCHTMSGIKASNDISDVAIVDYTWGILEK